MNDDGTNLKALTSDTLSFTGKGRWTKSKAYIFAETEGDTIRMLTKEGTVIDFINGFDPYPFFDDKRIIYSDSRYVLWVMDYHISCNPFHSERLRYIHENMSWTWKTLAAHPFQGGFVFIGKKLKEDGVEKNYSVFAVDENWNYTMTLNDSIPTSSFLSNIENYSAAYSPEGDRLFFHDKEKGTKWIYFHENAIKDYEFGLPEGEEIGSMAWSDDPDKLALNVSGNGKNKIYLYHISSQKLEIFREESEFQLNLLDYR